jgi:hypothetical protein
VLAVAPVVALGPGLAGPARAANVVDLGAFVPAGLNAKDQVVGNILDGSVPNALPRAGVWSNGFLSPLPEQSGATQSDALAINQAGRIVGDDTVPTAHNGPDTHAVFWDLASAPTQVGPIASVGAGGDSSQANGVDTAGDVAGITVGPLQGQTTGFVAHIGGSLRSSGVATRPATTRRSAGSPRTATRYSARH